MCVCVRARVCVWVVVVVVVVVVGGWGGGRPPSLNKLTVSVHVYFNKSPILRIGGIRFR